MNRREGREGPWARVRYGTADLLQFWNGDRAVPCDTVQVTAWPGWQSSPIHQSSTRRLHPSHGNPGPPAASPDGDGRRPPLQGPAADTAHLQAGPARVRPFVPGPGRTGRHRQTKRGTLAPAHRSSAPARVCKKKKEKTAAAPRMATAHGCAAGARFSPSRSRGADWWVEG